MIMYSMVKPVYVQRGPSGRKHIEAGCLCPHSLTRTHRGNRPLHTRTHTPDPDPHPGGQTDTRDRQTHPTPTRRMCFTRQACYNDSLPHTYDPPPHHQNQAIPRPPTTFSPAPTPIRGPPPLALDYLTLTYSLPTVSHFDEAPLKNTCHSRFWRPGGRHMKEIELKRGIGRR